MLKTSAVAWIPMYLLDKDVAFLNDWLNQEEEIAFLLSDGYKRWIAKKEHAITASSFFVEYSFWHIPSGALPLLMTNRSTTLRFTKEDWEEDGKVDNPWLGWTESRTGANPRVPYFGAGHPGVISLEIKLPYDDEIRMSSFGWIGSHYKIIGNGVDQSTEKFWNKMRRMVTKTGVHIPRRNDPSLKKEIYAFPAAYEAIKNGRPCALNP